MKIDRIMSSLVWLNGTIDLQPNHWPMLTLRSIAFDFVHSKLNIVSIDSCLIKYVQYRKRMRSTFPVEDLIEPMYLQWSRIKFIFKIIHRKKSMN